MGWFSILIICFAVVAVSDRALRAYSIRQFRIAVIDAAKLEDRKIAERAVNLLKPQVDQVISGTGKVINVNGKKS